MKKLFKRNEGVHNTVEAFEARVTCGCVCICKCGCQGTELYANAKGLAKDNDRDTETNGIKWS